MSSSCRLILAALFFRFMFILLKKFFGKLLTFAVAYIIIKPWQKRGDEMSPRTGRPIKGDSKRDKSLQLRMSQQELDLLDECAQTLEITRTDVVNKGIRLVKAELDKK